eukprot:TRINITY_DN16546_c0_g1_i1.p1 TRINITY_DN16546_c0_g1~~TRINITY_DN16546_c0_g1_i1.p1  ORF type:complete len:204 (-),score=77.21 TRINITY_DN16546_c0_g1_i1:62-637(-)
MEHKLCMLGGGGVGKSALTIWFVHRHFVEVYDPTIEDSYRTQATVDDSHYMLEIIDTAGQEEYSCMRPGYMRAGEGFLMVFDVTQQSSFDEICGFREELLRVKDSDDVPMVLVGNKCDLVSERQVSKSEGEQLAKSFGCKYIEASAKECINVEEAFHECVRTIETHEAAQQKRMLNANNNGKKKSKKCLVL